MISAIALVLFVRDKYTINILVEFDAVSVLLLTSLIPEEEQAENKIANVKSRCVIEMLALLLLIICHYYLFHLITAEHVPGIQQVAGYLFSLTGLSRCEKVSEPIFHLPPSFT